MKNPRGIVAIILSLCIGLALLVTVTSWGFTDREPEPVIAAEVLALIAAALGAVSVYIGMNTVSEAKESDEDIMRDWGGDDDESDPEAEADDDPQPDEDRA